MTRSRRLSKIQQPQRPRFPIHLSPTRQREIAGFLLLLLAALTLLSLLNIAPGFLSEAWARVLRTLMGSGAFGLPILIAIGGALLMRRGDDADKPFAWGRVVAAEILFAAALALLHLIFFDSKTPPENAGGFIGVALGALENYVGSVGAALIYSIAALVALPPLLGLNTAKVRAWSEALAARAQANQTRAPVAKSSAATKSVPAPKPASAPISARFFAPPAKPIAPPARVSVSAPIKTSALASPILTPRQRHRRRAPALPPNELLDPSSETKYGETDANRKARVIEETLANFGIPVKVVEINAGPTITQFGLEPGFVTRRGSDGETRQRKVSVTRIAALQHDLELALAAAPLRIEAPVPGRAMVGIEVPNESVSIVSLRGVLDSEAWKKKKSAMMLALGRDVSGRGVIADLETMPHLLVAGATGSGKSVCINAIVACLLFNNTPDDMRFVMVDPKRVELTTFNGVPHLLGPVITDIAQVVPALRWITREMDQRFALFAKTGVRNIESFNAKMEKSQGDTMPYLVVLIDELADLMLAAPDETEKQLTRLAQLARATGIHLILATQRPSVDVVTGLIKANFPARISFAVTSSVDSRVVLDSTGAEKLLGRGDMLYMSSDSSKLLRLQGCFVSDDELARLVKFWREKAITDMRDVPQEPPWKGMGGGKEGPDDALIAKAIDLLRQYDRTSISFLQRKLGIGYPRAARLMDLLEEQGIVGADEGGDKPRAVKSHDA
ncbi:MAG: DNA translocase FtsK 4TM domain-containing protein, partial [Chloroflexi bacterium]|nr:DNA translocase FtsK 4TM domain-containing protein [Chloroflexota bacterium]